MTLPLRCNWMFPWMVAACCLMLSAGCSDSGATAQQIQKPAPTTPLPVDDLPEQTEPATTPPAELPAVAPSEEESSAANDTVSSVQTSAFQEAAEEEQPQTEPQAKLFEDWPKPEVVLVFSGQQHGYLEPCGCTGLANQKGGVMRRATFLKELRSKGWDVVPLDVGNQVRRFGKQPEIKFQRTAEALRKMQYEAAVLGNDDLKLPTLEVFTGTNDGVNENIFVSANVALLDRSQTPEYRIIQAGGKRIGVTGVLSDSFREKLTGDELVHVPAEEGLAEVTKKLVAEKCDLLVLLAYATLDETADLAKKFPQYKLVATGGGVGEPPLDMEAIPGTDSKQIQVGAKAMYVMAVGLFDDQDVPFRTQRVPLDSRFKDAPEMLHLMDEYQEQLKAIGLEGLGLKPLPHPTEYTFVGTEKCGECHTEAYAVWKKTPHAHATDSIVAPPERSSIPRHFDPECLSCHVTGWEPQKMYPYISGYLGLDQTPLMMQNGCENCHGPGSKHVAAESGDLNLEPAAVQSLRDQMKLPLANDVAKRRCMECHDIDNSPDFHDPGAFEKYWKEVEHHGKD